MLRSKGYYANDPSWIVRASAAGALGSYEDTTILPELEYVLRNPQEESAVQAYAARSLGLIADPTYGPTLNALLAETQVPQVRAALLAAGYRLGEQQYLDPLLDMLERADASDSWSLLDKVEEIVEDMVEDRVEASQLPTLIADITRIRAALQKTALRWPITARQVQEIESQLPSP